MKYFYILRNNVTDTIGWVLVNLAWLLSILGYMQIADKLYTKGCIWYSYHKENESK